MKTSGLQSLEGAFQEKVENKGIESHRPLKLRNSSFNAWRWGSAEEEVNFTKSCSESPINPNVINKAMRK